MRLHLENKRVKAALSLSQLMAETWDLSGKSARKPTFLNIFYQLKQ